MHNLETKMADIIIPLLLKNGGQDKNMCSLNSILQLLQNIPEFLMELQGWSNTSAIINELINQSNDQYIM